MRIRFRLFKYQLRFLYIVVLFLLPIVLFNLPASYFDNGQTKCLSVFFFRQECSGCGMTRALQHLIHLEFEKTLQLNKLAFIVLPILIFLWYRELHKTVKKFNDR
jgi:hypothetical protein